MFEVMIINVHQVSSQIHLKRNAQKMQPFEKVKKTFFSLFVGIKHFRCIGIIHSIIPRFPPISVVSLTAELVLDILSTLSSLSLCVAIRQDLDSHGDFFKLALIWLCFFLERGAA